MQVEGKHEGAEYTRSLLGSGPWLYLGRSVCFSVVLVVVQEIGRSSLSPAGSRLAHERGGKL